MIAKTSLFKKLGIAVLGITMALSFSACGIAKTPEAIMKSAQEKFKNVKSLSYDMKFDIGMSALGQELNINMDMKSDFIIEPFKMAMDMSMDMGEMGSANAKNYIIEKDGSYIVYTGTENDSGEFEWASETLDDPDTIAQFNAKDSMNTYFEGSAEYKEIATEKIGDEDAVRYDGVISKESIDEVLNASGIFGQFSSLGLDVDDIKDAYSEIDDLTVSIWIGKKSGMPVKFEMDMASAMQSILSKITSNNEDYGDIEITVSKANVSMTITNFDGVESIEIPQAALDAE